MDELKQHMEQRLVETGYATKDKNDEMCYIKISTRENRALLKELSNLMEIQS